jgi:enoyl-CoA hydratase/carnithine racemase
VKPGKEFNEMEFQTIVVETCNAVAWIRLNRPKLMNAISPELVDELDERISTKSPLGLRRMKEVVADAAEEPDECGLRLERLALAAHLHSEDLREGLHAFSEKRAPVFRGR